jgi:hypothetical protein
MIERLIQPIVKIAGIADIVGIVSSNPQIRKRKDRSIALLMQRSGVRSTIPLDMI